MNNRNLALIAATATETIYGINHTIAKGLMPQVIQPEGFILLRVGGAALLFWTLSLFVKSEPIEKRDWLRILACAIFGMVLNMLMFFKGLSLSTPINSAVSMTVTPILLLILSAFLLKEKISWLKAVGILIGLSGALILIMFQKKTQFNAPNIPLGNLLFILNAISYAFYIILAKPLISKYKPVTLLKYFFLISLIINLPIGFKQVSEVAWIELNTTEIGQLMFVVIATTFFTYLLNIFALKRLSPSTLGVFIYLQPLVATIFAVFVGADTLTPIRIAAGFLIFIGVYLTTIKRKSRLKIH